MNLVYYILVFILGLCAGSFLNCLIYRMEKRKSFVKGRSFCPKCKQGLRWYDLIPVLSFIMLRGKCRYCKKKISFQYPITEISTGLIFLLISNFQFPISNEFSILKFSNLIYFWIVTGLLEIIFVYDFKHFIIPDKIIYPAIGVVFLYQLFGNWKLEIGNLSPIINPLLSAIAAAGFFFLIWLVSRGKWMGFGDVKLAFLMGLLLNFPSILVALFFAFFIGAIIGLGLISLGKKRLKSEVPFGPFLVAGTFIALFWGERIIEWYLSFLY